MVGECTQMHSHGSRDSRSLDAFRPTPQFVMTVACRRKTHLALVHMDCPGKMTLIRGSIRPESANDWDEPAGHVTQESAMHA